MEEKVKDEPIDHGSTHDCCGTLTYRDVYTDTIFIVITNDVWG